MPIQRLDGLSSAYAVGQNAGSYIAKAADAAANVACNIYRKHPGFVLPPDVFGLAPSVVQASRGIWDSLCGGRGTLPPEPSVPFAGGQCVCSLYRVTFSIKTEAPDGTVTTSTSLGDFRGPIGGMTRRPHPTLANRFDWFLSHGSPECPPLESGVRGSVADNVNVSIASVTPAASQPNNCGSKPPQYQPSFPRPSDQSGNTTIVNNNGVNVTVPFAYVPVSIQPTFSPQIRVDLGGLNFRFDLGGVDVQFPELAPSPPGTSPVPGGGGNKPDCPPCGGSEPSPTPGDPELPPTETEPKPGADEDVPGIRYLEVVVTKLPDKVHFGEGGQNVIFAGWVAFRAKSGGYFPRQQINFAQSVFKAPEGAEGYTLTFTNGAEGRAREYTEENEV